MAKVGRNDLCPCNSGKKYKKCCMARDEAAASEKRATEAVTRAAAVAAAHEHSHLCHDCHHEIDEAGDAVFALIEAQKFDEAEQAAHELLARFPTMHDGYECLGKLYQAKGDHHQAAECYRKVIEFARNEPEFYNPHFVGYFQGLIDQLEPQEAAAAD
jgi:Flp pilus assembly protein TadD